MTNILYAWYSEIKFTIDQYVMSIIMETHEYDKINHIFFKKSKWNILQTTTYLHGTRCTLEDNQNIRYLFRSSKQKSANARTKKWGLTPIMKTIRKYNKFSSKPPKWEKFNSLQKLRRRTFLFTKNSVIPFLP